MDAAFKALADYGVTVVGIVAMAFFLYKLHAKLVANLEKDRDRAMDMAEGGTKAIDRLTDEVAALRDELRRR